MPAVHPVAVGQCGDSVSAEHSSHCLGRCKRVDSERGGGLFDLATDIGEKNDLSAKHPTQLEKMKARFEAWKAEMDAAEPRGPFRDF